MDKMNGIKIFTIILLFSITLSGLPHLANSEFPDFMFRESDNYEEVNQLRRVSRGRDEGRDSERDWDRDRGRGRGRDRDNGWDRGRFGGMHRGRFRDRDMERDRVKTPEIIDGIIQKGKSREFLKRYEEEAKLYESEGRKFSASKAYVIASHLASASGNYHKAVSDGVKAINLAAESGDPIALAEANFSAALAYIAVADYDRALPLLKKAAEIVSRIGIGGFEATINEKIGKVYMKQSDYGKAIEYLKKAFICHFPYFIFKDKCPD